MAKARAIGLGVSAKSEIIGPVIAIYDAFDNPLCIVVEISPGLQHVYSVAINETEFRDAITRYGVELNAKVVDVRT